MCAGAAFWSQIGRIVYGATDEKRGYNKWQCKVHPKTEVKNGVLSNECEDLLTAFFDKMRKK
jgi:tRNA(adenine34) deaminase